MGDHCFLVIDMTCCLISLVEYVSISSDDCVCRSQMDSAHNQKKIKDQKAKIDELRKKRGSKEKMLGVVEQRVQELDN